MFVTISDIGYIGHCRLEHFSKGKSIKHEREKLAKLNEHMRFKGGPRDHNYARRIKKEAFRK